MFLFPFLVFFIEKTPARISLPILVSIQILFEVWAADTLTSASYRLCAIRYLMMPAAGIYLAKGYFNALKITACFILGAAYIYLINYTTFQPKLFFE